MHIEIYGKVRSEKRTGEKGEYLTHEQDAVLFQDGIPFPLRFTFRPKDGVQYEEGVKYEMASSCFRIGKYGSLELDPFKFELVRMSEGFKSTVPGKNAA